MGLKCQINVERPLEGAFRPGDSVIGTVNYSLTKDTAFENAILSLKGRSKCSWKEKNRPESGGQSRFNGKENLVDINLNLLGNAYGIIPAGIYEAPFCFTLPKNLPPSFTYDGHRASAVIEYCVRVKFTYPGIFSFPIRYFAAVSIMNTIIPTIPLEPTTYALHDSLSKKFGITYHDFDLKVTLSKPLIPPGENAELCLQVHNNTKFRVSKIKISLFQILTLSDDACRTKVIQKEIEDSRVKTAKIGKTNYTCLFSTVTIPSDLISLQGSRLVSRDYKLGVEVEIPDMKREFNLDVPILVGRIETPNVRNSVAVSVENEAAAAAVNSEESVNIIDTDVEVTAYNQLGKTLNMSRVDLTEDYNHFVRIDDNDLMTHHNLVENYNQMRINNNDLVANVNNPSASSAPPPYWEVVDEEKHYLN